MSQGRPVPDLDAIIRDIYSLYEDQDSIEVASPSVPSAIIAHGWYQRVRLTGEAVIKLSDLGYENEVVPLRRSMIEHSLALHWLSDATTAAVDALLAAHKDRMKKVRNSLTDGWSVTADDFDQILSLEVPKSSEATYLAFAHMCQKYESPNLYVAWLTETGLCHPSYTSAIAYAEDAGMHEQMRLLARAPGNRHDARRSVAVFALVASQGFNKILVGAPWRARLRDLEARLEEAIRNEPAA